MRIGEFFAITLIHKNSLEKRMRRCFKVDVENGFYSHSQSPGV
jgi:hypothetical protein